MLKKVYALTLIAAACLGGSAFAQSLKADPKTNLTLKQECPTDIGKCVRADLPCVQANPICNPALMRGIELTAEQKAKLDKFADKEAKERAKTREKAAKDRKAFAEKRDKELKKVLTPAQYEQYKANKKALKESKRDLKRHKKHGKKSRTCPDNKMACKHHNDSKCCNKPCPARNCEKPACGNDKK